MADCSGNCGTACSSGCGSACSDGCTGCGSGCATTCIGGCYGTCYTGCTGTCKGTCTGTCCTGCTNACVAACSLTCNTACKGNCYKECNTTCYTTCKDICKGYCKQICQTYCEKQQVFSLNVAPIKNPVGKGAFTWTNAVCQGQTIQITHGDWNTLKSYIQTATQYCGGTSPSQTDAAYNDLITDIRYNDLADGLALSHVTKDQTIISASIIDLLRTTYNERKILSNLPSNPGEGSSNLCCQVGEICMAAGEFLEHQGKTESCQDQTTSSCGGQSPGS